MGKCMQVDRDGTGLLTPEAITRFLGDLGLEPTSHDVQLVMEELDPRRTGSVTRDDFMQFIRNGGRRHLPPLPDPLDRRLSIELDADKVEAAGAHLLRPVLHPTMAMSGLRELVLVTPKLHDSAERHCSLEGKWRPSRQSCLLN